MTLEDIAAIAARPPHVVLRQPRQPHGPDEVAAATSRCEGFASVFFAGTDTSTGFASSCEGFASVFFAGGEVSDATG